MFFVVSGYLFAKGIGEDGWYAKKLHRRFKSLLVPYVFWDVAYWLLMAVLGIGSRLAGVEFGDLANVEGMMSAKWDLLGLNPLCFPALGLLWYVRVLLVLCVVSPIFYALCKYRGGGQLFSFYT